MGFLDNSGDIILDAVLTDLGRQRLAKGDGSFRITKFALADDEIDYSLYKNSNNANGAHPSGSAYYDLEILQTPVLEGFTNNSSLMKSKLMTVSRTNILFLPVLKLAQGAQKREPFYSATESYLIAVNEATQDSNVANSVKMDVDGIFYGSSGFENNLPITVDSGLDTDQISNKNPLDASLTETAYEVQIDNRFGRLVSPQGVPASVSYIDDSQIATYYFSMKSDKNYFENISDASVLSAVQGPRGSRFIFKVASSIELATSTFLFNKLGGNTLSVSAAAGGTVNVKYIDTTIRVTGVNTGYSLRIPVRFIRSPS
tara:strand:- start:3156 stop:4100 length:945 start_codon:yes stop_codon:yes gene_type:complete